MNPFSLVAAVLFALAGAATSAKTVDACLSPNIHGGSGATPSANGTPYSGLQNGIGLCS